MRLRCMSGDRLSTRMNRLSTNRGSPGSQTAEADRLRKLAERQTREAVQDKAEARGVVVSPR